jgi:hypothetical protein
MDSTRSGKDPAYRKPRTVWFIVGVCFLIIACIAFTVSIIIIRNAYYQTPRIVNIPNSGSSGEFVHTLSIDQQKTIEELGYPDAFTIYFYQNNPDAGYDQGIRFETWTYYNESIMLSFQDGEPVNQEIIDSAPGNNLPMPYQPEQFATFMSLNRLIKSTGIQTYLILPLGLEVIRDGQVFYADQLTFGMKNGRLMYVETLALTEDK